MRTRSNEAWRAELAEGSAGRDAALADLRAWLLRTAQFYLRRQAPQLTALRSEQVAELAEDAAQEATLAVLAKLESFRGEAAFLTWASKFGVSAAAALLRRRQWRDVSLDALPGWEPSIAAVTQELDAGPDTIAQRHEAWRLLQTVLEEDLTSQQRSVLNLVLFQGLPQDEVAERLGISRGACYKAGHDMRRTVKRGIERRGWSSAEMLAAFAAPVERGA